MCEYAMRRSHNWLRKKENEERRGILIKAFSQSRRQVNQKETGGIVKKGKKKLALHALGMRGHLLCFSACQMEKASASKQQKREGFTQDKKEEEEEKV